MNEEHSAPNSYEIEVQDQADLHFTGQELASVTSQHQLTKYGTSKVTVTVYLTCGGKYIYVKKVSGITEAHVFNSVIDVINCIGYDDSSKKLYKKLGWPHYMVIE